jgi:hypothetical protein
MRKTLRRGGSLLIVASALFVLSGCANYWRYRAEDFAETFDLGATFSKKPQFAFYNSFESIVALGYANCEVTFVGWGGGRFGVTPHYLKAWGLLAWGDESVGWGDYDKYNPATLYQQTVGFVGMPYGLITGHSNPCYVPT